MNIDLTLYRLQMYRKCIEIRENDQVEKAVENAS